MSHAVRVTLRAGAATACAAAAGYALAPALAPLATVVAAVMVVAFELTRVRASLDRKLAELAGDVAQTQPLLALHAMLRTRRPLPDMRGYAIAPDFGVMLAQLVFDERPRVVVETGSGVSTLVIAYALERLGNGGKVIALEHDPDYARRTRDEVHRHGLDAFAEVIDAPLEPVRIAGGEYRWYARRALDGIAAIDLVVDDGPPRCAGAMLRYASLPILGERLRGLFVLDVVGEEEREILARWRRELPAYDHEYVPTKKGNVVIRRRAAEAV